MLILLECGARAMGKPKALMSGESFSCLCLDGRDGSRVGRGFEAEISESFQIQKLERPGFKF